MVARSWIGGGNNDASNPKDWSPAGSPQPGDSLAIPGVLNETMNIAGNVLQEDAITIPGGSNGSGSQPIDTLNLSRGANVTSLTEVQNVRAVINISGTDSLNVIADGDVNGGCLSIINLAENSRWIGTYNGARASGLTVNGGPNAYFINNGTSSVGFPATATINVPIKGKGLIISNFRTEFGSSVGADQTIQTYGIDGADVITIDHPDEFHGLADMVGATEIDLIGLAGADSYTFKNDMLRLYSGCNDIYDMRLKDDTQFYTNFQVTETAEGISVYLEGGNGVLAGALPVHHA